jgi:type I restriction enzyme M protein
MLDTDTKAKIDSARDILVGKVPDPKSQVEQITIALIYKFMDDMDRQSEELGGKATFFTGEFKKYRWGYLLDKRVGGHERLLLYAEGIEKMNENAAIPQLFRDIFKGVFLPYRDPETLNLFLKEINGFTYDHSEQLGDAFEYLLSVLGSQGGAGQFRTPRHIIDFIVQLVDPQKSETFLDPACGTAGFLVAGYKHILRSNTDRQPGDMLSGDERQRLIEGITGYDIAPDMVRLSLVNLYLHGFSNPRITEYDTLTNEDRWDDRFDVVMANPPFMTPKGGIRPHSRFSIKSRRSELLFTDYIVEHLMPHGRAGIIVPNGVLFDPSQGAKRLRSSMLKECRIDGIIGLPPGVFRPYSDSETAILLLTRGQPTENVWFYQVGSDGYSLDDRRSPTDDSDLPDALAQWATRGESAKSFTVDIKEITKHGEVLLPAQYRANRLSLDTSRVPKGWRLAKLGDIVEEVNTRAGAASRLPVLSVTKYDGFVESLKYFRKQVFSRDTAKYKVVKEGEFAYSAIHLDEGAVALLSHLPAGIISPMYKVFRIRPEVDYVDPVFFLQLLKSDPLIDRYTNLGKGSVKRRKSIAFSRFASIEVPIPPSRIQADLVGQASRFAELRDEATKMQESINSGIHKILATAGLEKVQS